MISVLKRSLEKNDMPTLYLLQNNWKLYGLCIFNMQFSINVIIANFVYVTTYKTAVYRF